MFGFGNDPFAEEVIEEIIIDETIGYPGYGYNRGYGGYGYPVDPFLAAEEVFLAEEIVEDLFDSGW